MLLLILSSQFKLFFIPSDVFIVIAILLTLRLKPVEYLNNKTISKELSAT